MIIVMCHEPRIVTNTVLCTWDRWEEATKSGNGYRGQIKVVFPDLGYQVVYERRGRDWEALRYWHVESNGTPLQNSCLENPMDGGAWWAAVHGVAKSRTWLSDFTFTFHFYALEKEMATHSSVLAWRIPGMGLHRVGHDWSDLAARYWQYFSFQFRWWLYKDSLHTYLVDSICTFLIFSCMYKIIHNF